MSISSVKKRKVHSATCQSSHMEMSEISEKLMEGIYADCQLDFGGALVYAHKLLLTEKLPLLKSFNLLEQMSSTTNGGMQVARSTSEESKNLPVYRVMAEPLAGWEPLLNKSRVKRSYGLMLSEEEDGPWRHFVTRFWSFVYGICESPRATWFEIICSAILLDKLLCADVIPKSIGLTTHRPLPPFCILRSSSVSLCEIPRTRGVTFDGTERVFIMIDAYSHGVNVSEDIFSSSVPEIKSYFRGHRLLRDAKLAFDLLIDARMEFQLEQLFLEFTFQPPVDPLKLELYPETMRDLRLDVTRHLARYLYGVEFDWADDPLDFTFLGGVDTPDNFPTIRNVSIPSQLELYIQFQNGLLE